MLSAVAGFLDYLEAECGLAANTCLAYRRDLVQFGAALADAGCPTLRQITPGRIEQFLRSAGAAGKAPASVARALAAVRMFCRFCVLEALLDDDPSGTVLPPKKWARLPVAPSDQAVGMLLAAPSLGEDAHWLRDRAILTLLYASLVRKYVRRAAIRGRVSPHTLRHCFATHMLAGGANLRTVQELLGHADIASTQIYTHVDLSRLKAVHKKYHPRG